MDNGLAMQKDGVPDDNHDNSEELQGSSSPGRSTGHRRSLSNTILSRLSFLRTTSEEMRMRTPSEEETTNDAQNTPAPTIGGAMAFAQTTIQGRKRKGSLRKAALLGTGKFKAEIKERRSTLPQRRPSVKQTEDMVISLPDDNVLPSDAVQALQRRLSYEEPAADSAEDSSPVNPDSPRKLPVLPLKTNFSTPGDSNGISLASPIKTPTSQSYASTTDEEEALSFSRPVPGVLHQQVHDGSPPSDSSTSPYFPPPQTITRSRSSAKPHSPLSALPMDAYTPEEEWDYSNTEWWGWVVLIVTWIVFVVGMGSCLDVWSWAWDVGQTPYAPPELEDDPTLPIVGYYPALIILTAVMAWVWVVIAWVGMKYFKHAKIQGDDS